MKKSIKIAFAVAFLTSMTGCAYYGSSSVVSENDYDNSIKIKEDMDKISAAIRMASVNRNAEKIGTSEKIKKSLVADGILIEYPSFDGMSYTLRTADGKDAFLVEDVSFVSVDKYVGKGVCGEINRQSGIYEIVSVDDQSSQIEKYYASVSKNHDIDKVASLPKTVCYEKAGKKGGVGYEVVSLVSKVSLLKGA